MIRVDAAALAPIPAYISPEVEAFAALMQGKIALHLPTRGTGWKGASVDALAVRLLEEVIETLGALGWDRQRATQTLHQMCRTLPKTGVAQRSSASIGECVDIGALAMMISDVLTGLDPAKRQSLIEGWKLDLDHREARPPATLLL